MTTTQRTIRRIAMQALYQIDMRGEDDLEAVRESVEFDAPDREIAAAAFNLARSAWEQRGQADAIATELAEDWPTHRQPPVDRAILRLAWYEISSGYSPAKVAINEAIELAKQFCDKQSPAFINGITDKMAKRSADHPATEAASDPGPAESA